MRVRTLGVLFCAAALVACAAPSADDASSPSPPPRGTSSGGPAGGPPSSPPADAPPAPRSSCPNAEEPRVGSFAKIYDPSAGESRAFYINDHTFVRAKDGTWHLFGITHAEPADPMDEKAFAHATAPSLMGPWTKKPDALTADPSHGETLLWAPYVLAAGDTYYMFYCGGGADRTKFQIALATSKDLQTWTREPAPLFVDGYDARDPYVTKIGGEWVLYYTGTSTPSGGHHVVFYRTSTDLRHWSDKAVAFEDPSMGDYAGPTESPFVVARGDDYYLFIGPREAYADTAVFHSKDPHRFDPNDRVYRFASHAAEVVVDVDGTLYASHAGWGQGGVHLAPLTFEPTECKTIEGKDYRAIVQTKPGAGLVELAIPSASGAKSDVLSRAFRTTGPYLGVGTFGSHPAGAATTVTADDTRITLSGIRFGDEPVTADWTLCRGDDYVDQRLTWHVAGATSAPLWEISLGIGARSTRVADDTHADVTGDYPGIAPFVTFGMPGGGPTFAVAYAPGSAWREDNHWLSPANAAASIQPLWQSGGTMLAPGTYEGGVYRLGTKDGSTLAAGVRSTSTPCTHVP